jgi:hypothetical protein
MQVTCHARFAYPPRNRLAPPRRPFAQHAEGPGRPWRFEAAANMSAGTISTPRGQPASPSDGGQHLRRWHGLHRRGCGGEPCQQAVSSVAWTRRARSDVLITGPDGSRAAVALSLAETKNAPPANPRATHAVIANSVQPCSCQRDKPLWSRTVDGSSDYFLQLPLLQAKGFATLSAGQQLTTMGGCEG